MADIEGSKRELGGRNGDSHSKLREPADGSGVFRLTCSRGTADQGARTGSATKWCNGGTGPEDSAGSTRFFGCAHRSLPGPSAGAGLGGVYLPARDHPAPAVFG